MAKFLGLRPFVERAAASRFPDLEPRPAVVGQVLALPVVGRVGTALGQAGESADPEARAAVALEAERQRDVLALALAGVEAAIADFYRSNELPPPRFAARSTAIVPVRKGPK